MNDTLSIRNGNADLTYGDTAGYGFFLIGKAVLSYLFAHVILPDPSKSVGFSNNKKV